ncbi:hypothetical protein [Nocardioides stalactiti]|uniref:hypothetical protein n=1 Tax=Nocardioides stalactiti TaxID=2755356 RepID=UPI001602DA4B|nr:hypothetical protein [Nocardioides stalactiti]
MKTTRTRRLLLAVPATALALTTLVGCGDILKDQVEKKVEDAAKSEGVDLDVDLDSGDVKVDTTDGGAVTGELPKDYPSDEAPVVDGEILAGTYTKNPASWNVTIEVGPAGGDKQGAYDEAAAKLLDGGASEGTAPVDNGTSISGTYLSASYTIVLAVTDSNGIVVNYTVSPK